MLIVNTMCKLLAAMLVGYVMGRKGVLDQEVNGKLSSLIVRVTCPFLIVSSISAAGRIERSEVMFMLAVGVVIYLMTPVLAAVLVRLLRLPRTSAGVYQCMLVFANCIFMGLPVCQAFFGEEAVFCVSVIHLPFNLLFYSYGVLLLSRDSEVQAEISLKALMNPGIVSALIALVLFLGEIRLPEVINGSLGFIGSVTTPLSMMVIGSSIAAYSFGEIFRQKSLYLISALRLIIFPLLAYAVMNLVTDNLLLIRLVTVTAGMPVASLVVMGASEYQGDVRMASFGVAMTTVCSIITIPIIALFLGV